jgi:coenzyme F420-dependent glucose-6-phosphate dehydrogenase
MTSDHFHPWWQEGGYGNFTWVWLDPETAWNE